MIDSIKIGDTVKVWPKPGLAVQSHADIAGRFLATEGQEVVWTEWLRQRLADGSLLLTDPHRKPTAAEMAEQAEAAAKAAAAHAKAAQEIAGAAMDQAQEMRRVAEAAKATAKVEAEAVKAEAEAAPVDDKPTTEAAPAPSRRKSKGE